MDRDKHSKFPQTGDSLKEAAHAYHRLGINVLAVKGKRPAGSSWKRWCVERQTQEDIERLFRTTGITGISAITGPVSGNLACLDIDKAQTEDVLFRVLKAVGLRPTYPWIVDTPGGGYHIWLVCPDLDEALCDKGKLVADLGGCKQIELRWKGHQTLLPPSLHPNGGTYRFRNSRES